MVRPGRNDYRLIEKPLNQDWEGELLRRFMEGFCLNV